MRYLIIVIVALGFLHSCEKSTENDPNPNCPELILNDSIPDSLLVGINIISLEIVDDCINFEIGFSGCDANHIVDLIMIEKFQDNGMLKFKLGFRDNNPQLCLAYFTENYSYDLSVIEQEMGDNTSAELIFINSEKTIVFQP